MSEELSSLHIALKAMGLQETTRGVQELDRVLKATGLSAEQLAKEFTKVEQAQQQLESGNSILLRLMRDGEQTASRYATASERLGMQLQAVHQQYSVGAIGLTAYNRALTDLNSQMAVLEGRASSLASKPSPMKMWTDAASLTAIAEGRASPIGTRGRNMAAEEFRLDLNSMSQAAVNSGTASPLSMGRTGERAFIGLEQVEHAAKLARVETEIADSKRTQLAIDKDKARKAEELNALTLQAGNLERQLYTAEEAHNKRVQSYQAMRKAGLIEEHTLQKAIAQSQVAMRSQSMSGGGRGQMAFQAAYGIQDFATVMAMGGGAGRAILSAQNNLSQMLMVSSAMNPVLSATLGTVAALAAIMGPTLWENYVNGANKAKDATERLKQAVSDLNAMLKERRAGMESGMTASRLASRGTSQEIQDSINSRGDANELRREQLTDNADAERRMRRVILTDPNLRREAGTAAVNAQLAAAFSGGPKMGSAESKALGQQAFDAYMQQQLRENEEIQKILGERRDLQSAIKRDEAAISKLLQGMAAAYAEEKRQVDAGLDMDSRMRNRSAGESMLKSMTSSQRAADIANKVAIGDQFQMQDDFESFYGDVANSGQTTAQKQQALGDFSTNQRSVIQRRIADLQKQSRPSMDASFTSFSGFGQQLQLSLLKPQDEAKKQRDEQIKLLRQADAALQKMANDGIKSVAMASP